MVDREAALRIQRRGLADFVGLLGRSSPGARLFEAGEGALVGAVVPACPERSLVNSVVYDDVAALAGALEPLREAYLEAGVSAWLVWVPEFDREAIALLREAGYRFDGAPAAMHAELGSLAAEPGELDWDAAATAAEVGAVNDRAYGFPPGRGLSPALAALDAPVPVRLYRARAGGEVACVAGTMDHGSDLGVYFVATLPGRRGRGLASRLMAAAFAEAASRGMATTSLQASPMGEPVYARLGYRTAFRYQLWEYRRAPGE